MLRLAIVQVNKWGNVVYDKHVRPQEFVKDFRTAVSGVRPRDLRKGISSYSAYPFPFYDCLPLKLWGALKFWCDTN
jgi:hypothetical protein